MSKPSREFLYGLNPAFETLRAGRRTVYNAFLNVATSERGRLATLADKLSAAGVEIEYTDKGRLHQLCGSTEHQGIVLRVSTYPYTPKDELFNGRRLLLIDNVEDPHNVGAMLRSAEVFGFHDILLPVKGVPEVYPSVVKVSAGAAEYLRISRECTANRYAQIAKEKGYQIASLDAKGKVPLEELAATKPEKLMLVIGGEDKGVGQFILNMSDAIVSVRQHGSINSLNASVAAGIAMYALA